MTHSGLHVLSDSPASANLRWFNLDMTTEEKWKAGILEEQWNRPGRFQEGVTHRVPSDDLREQAWVEKLENVAVGGTTLVICGYLHFEPLVQKLRASGHCVDKRVYVETVPTIKLPENREFSVSGTQGGTQLGHNVP